MIKFKYMKNRNTEKVRSKYETTPIFLNEISIEFTGFHRFSMVFIGVHWCSLVFIGVHWFSIDFTNFNGFQAKKSLKSTFGVQYIPLERS